MVIRLRRIAWNHSTTFEGRFSCAQNALQPMEAKRHIERTVLVTGEVRSIKLRATKSRDIK